MPNFSIPLSGLTAESTALSTIANNLSNQNTPGIKIRCTVQRSFLPESGNHGFR